MLRGRLKDIQENWDLQIRLCVMAYRSSVHEFTGEIPNMLMLGREIEVPLDVITEPAPDIPPLASEYGLALHQRLAGAAVVARTHLRKTSERQKRSYDKRVPNNHSGLGTVFGCTTFIERRGGASGFFLGRPLLSGVCAIRGGVSNPEMLKSEPDVIHAVCLKPHLRPALKSSIVEREGTVIPVEPKL